MAQKQSMPSAQSRSARKLLGRIETRTSSHPDGAGFFGGIKSSADQELTR
jgi:hypothetical protein